jgi:Domain of unknown function (DUF4126)
LCGYADPLRYNIRVEILLALGIGIGLASVAGVRAFLPLALAAFLVQLGLLPSLPLLYDPEFWGTVVVVLAGLAVLEIALDKIPAFDPAFAYTMIPVKIAAGAALGAAAFGVNFPAGSLVPGLVVGGVVAGAVALLKVLLRPSARVEASGVSTRFLSAVEDVVALVGAVVGAFIPFLPLFVVGFLLFFYYRVRKRRGRKYGGLRILGD